MKKIPFHLCDPTTYIQSGAAGHSLGFEYEDLEKSPGWWAATVAAQADRGNYPNFNLQN